MLRYFRLIKSLFFVNPALFWKTLFYVFLVSWIGWHFVLKRPVYQQIYGIPANEKLEIWESDLFEDIPEQKIIPIKINGYDIEIQAIKSFKTVSRIVYVDRYTPLGTWYRSLEGARLYDKIVPQDVSIATGVLGHHPECFNFSHEYRMLVPGNRQKNCSDTIYQNYTKEVSNNHVIAASDNIQKGLDILKTGDIAEIEGYAVYWNGTGNLRYQRFESAITLGQVSEQISGGMRAILCRQLLITKISFDGYTFE